MTKPVVTISSCGAGGNICNILAAVRTEMRKRALIQKYNDLRDDVTTCESYEAAVARIRQDVDLIDTDGEI